MRARILNASAGSGKTYQLAYKYVRDVVEQPHLYRHILAVTFTNKATEEMKSRILKEIHTLASGAESDYLKKLCDELSLDAHTVRTRAKEVRSKILHDYSRFTVLTIDTFFQRILRAFIKELGIDLNYNVEIETASVLTQSADTLIDQIATDRELQQWLMEFVEERIEEGRKWDVRDGILSLGGELFKEANKASLASARPKEELAGIVQRVLAGARVSKKLLQQRATEAIGIMHEAGVGASDFSGKSRSFANYFFALAGGEIKPYTATVAKMSTSTDGWCTKDSPALPLVGRLQPLLRELCDTYDQNVKQWNTAELLRENYRSFALLSDLYAKVQQLCDEQNMMLLSETKYILSQFIGHNDAPFIYEKVGNRFERFMIDEFQDTSVKEWENFLPLLQNAMAQSDQTSVLLVGDIKQSIYRWRGGDWRILHNRAQEALGGAENAPIIPLKENYRSLPSIVEFNNRIIGSIVQTDNGQLNTTLDEAVATGALPTPAQDELHDMLAKAYTDHEQTPRKRSEYPGYISLTTFDAEPPIVERIKKLIDKGFRPCDILILVRGAVDGAKVAATLLDFKCTNDDPRYRFDVMTQEALIVGYAPVSSFIIASLRLTLDPDDSLSRAIRNHYLGQPFDRPLDEQERDFFRTLRLYAPEEAFERIVMHDGLQHDAAQIAYLQALHEQIIRFSTAKVADIPLFLRWWDEQGSKRSLSVERSESTIEITTIHKAKGLEKKVVIIPNCSWQLDPKSAGNITNIIWAEPQTEGLDQVGAFPVKYKRAMAESAFSAEYYRELVYSHVDNINLLYVALTRAVESLHIFIPATSGSVATAGGMIFRHITGDGKTATIGDMQGSHTIFEAGEEFEFGRFEGPDPQGRETVSGEQVVLDSYPTAEADLQLRLPSQRYFEQGGKVELSPRNFGILMHKAFENATDEAGIYDAIAQMQADSAISSADTEQLRTLVAQALADKRVRSWFDGSWQQVRNEHEIIIPKSSTTRRPDRVMIRGAEAVVVDYKFGKREPEKYKRQIREYLDLLRQIGYKQVTGYLWFVRLGTVEQVED